MRKLTGSLSGRRLLLVEDNPGDVKLVEEALKEIPIKHTLVVAADGEEALLKLQGDKENKQKFRPDIIILDLNLPKKNGIEVLQVIKNDSDLQSIPVVIFSSSSRQEDISEVYRMCASSYFVKPVSYTQYIEIMKLITSFWEKAALVSN